MNVPLANNFFLNARGLTFEDSPSVTWAINKNLNQISATVISAIPSGANPAASVGLTVVNGTATTFMRSDAAPPLSQAIVPTWTGLHTFGAGVTISAGTFTLSGHTLALSANATVGGTNTGDQVLPSGGNPGSTIGLAAVNGVASTFMRSDGAPALSQAIAPTWTGLHTFAPASGLAIQINAPSGGGITAWLTGALSGAQSYSYWIGPAQSPGQSGGLIWENNSGSPILLIDTYASAAPIQLAGSQVTVLGKLGINSASPPAQITGWGTPTGAAVEANFAAGSGQTMAVISAAVAKIITDLKAFGLYGA